MRRSYLLTQTFLLLATLFTIASPALAQTDAPPPTKSGFVTTPDGIQIHYLEAGQAETVQSVPRGPSIQPRASNTGHAEVSRPSWRQAILFVPGWTMPADIWEKQVAHFAKDYRVVAMDPRSQGQSTKAADGHYPAARARDIKAVVDQLKLAPVVLVGWSMGVPEAAAYVDQFGTDTLAGLVLVDGVAGMDPTPEIYKAFLGLLNAMEQDRRKTTEAFVRSMYRTPQTEEYLKRIIESALQTPTNSAVTLGVSLLTNDHRPALAKINKPTLVVYAPGGPWDAAYADMQKRIPGSRIEKFEGAGHALFADHPDKFNALLDQFLKSLN